MNIGLPKKALPFSKVHIEKVSTSSRKMQVISNEVSCQTGTTMAQMDQVDDFVKQAIERMSELTRLGTTPMFQNVLQ